MKEKEREKKTIVNAAVGAVSSFLCVCVCVCLSLTKKAENKLVCVRRVFYITEGSTSKTPERPTRRLDCYWATWRTTCSPRCERSFLNRPTLFLASSAAVSRRCAACGGDRFRLSTRGAFRSSLEMRTRRTTAAARWISPSWKIRYAWTTRVALELFSSYRTCTRY